MKNILAKLFDHQRLTRQEAHDMLVRISENEFNETQIASFLTVFRMRPIALAELQGFRDALLELCVPIDLGGIDSIDIVGTGGDGKNTFNISTLSSIVVAGAGFKVSKHGNYGVSSACGSSNVLEHLGYRFTNDQDTLRRQLDNANICFFHAPFFHPAMKAVAPVRRALGIKTFFNMLGPLVNPGQPNYNLLGVYSLELSRLYQYILQEGKRNFAIVYALDGYDEISLTGKVKVRTNQSERIYDPTDFGKRKLDQAALFGGNTVEEAAKIFMDILNNNCTDAQRDVVSVNAGLAIQCLNPEKELSECIEMATESLISQKALQQFKNLIN